MLFLQVEEILAVEDEVNYLKKKKKKEKRRRERESSKTL